MNDATRKRTVMALVTGAVLSAPISYLLAQGNNFLEYFFIAYFGIWMITFLWVYVVLFYRRKFEKYKIKFRLSSKHYKYIPSKNIITEYKPEIKLNENK